jgi:DNA/RNA-binding protein KIN17
MPKAEKGSLKDLGKRIKAKGLQKLKFYCQMCEKQCRDANGFQCHLTSESHLRQMKIFSENAQSYMNRYSKEFETIFLDTLRMRHSTARVNANNVYQEVIRDKSHIHMNATIWATLTDFCKYLGKTGKCIVEETEQGWFVTYIERDISKLEREERWRQRQQAQQHAERIVQLNLEKQRIQAAKAFDRAGGILHVQPTQLQRNNHPEDDNQQQQQHGPPPIQWTLKTMDRKNKNKNDNILGWTEKSSILGGGDDSHDDNEDNKERSAFEKQSNHDDDKTSLPEHQPSKKQKHENDDDNNNNHRAKPPPPPPAAKSSLTKQQQEETKEQSWLYRDIVVRIVNPEIQPYYRCKAIVDKIIDDFTAQVIILVEKKKDDDKNNQKKASELDGDVLRIDQDDLETVVPKRPHEKVRIVRGPHRGRKAVAIQLDKQSYKAVLQFKDGTRLENVDYDEFSKRA